MWYQKQKMEIGFDFDGKEGRNAGEACLDCFIYYEADYKKIMNIGNDDELVFKPGKKYNYRYQKGNWNMTEQNMD